MTVCIEPFVPAHLDGFVPQAAQAAEIVGPLAAAAEYGPAFAAVDAQGRVLAIAGMAENHRRYATAWAIFAEGKGAAMVAVTRATRRIVQEALSFKYDRVDMMVRAGFDRAADFAELLGFGFEARLHRAAPDGGDYLLFSRVSRYPERTD